MSSWQSQVFSFLMAYKMVWKWKGLSNWFREAHIKISSISHCGRKVEAATVLDRTKREEPLKLFFQVWEILNNVQNSGGRLWQWKLNYPGKCADSPFSSALMMVCNWLFLPHIRRWFRKACHILSGMKLWAERVTLGAFIREVENRFFLAVCNTHYSLALDKEKPQAKSGWCFLPKFLAI